MYQQVERLLVQIRNRSGNPNWNKFNPSIAHHA